MTAVEGTLDRPGHCHEFGPAFRWLRRRRRRLRLLYREATPTGWVRWAIEDPWFRA